MNSRVMRQSGRWVALVIVAAGTFAACERQTPVAPSASAPTSDLANKKGGNQCSFGIRVTFGDGTTDKVRSDGRGAYVDGLEKIMAFTGNGPGFRLDTNGGSMRLEGSGGVRAIVVDFGGVLSSPPAPFAIASKGTDLRFFLNDGGLDLCSLTSIGSWGTVGLTIPFEVIGKRYNQMTLGYGVPTSQSDPTVVGQRAVVTRTGIAPDTWTVTGQYAALKDGDWTGSVVAGASNLTMPFAMTLVRK